MKILLWFLFGFVISAQCASGFIFDFSNTDVKKLEELSRNSPVGMNRARFRRRADQVIKVFYGLVKEFSEEYRKTILESLNLYENRTCLKFKKVDEEHLNDTFSEGDLIYIFVPLYPSFPKDIPFVLPFFHSTTIKNLNALIIPLHNDLRNNSLRRVNQQLFYALQFLPENLRSDRDKYVTVLWENIKPEYRSFFQISSCNITLGYPYDFHSISNYYPDDFAIDGKYTLISKVSNITLQRNTELSPLDVEKINTLYCGGIEFSEVQRRLSNCNSDDSNREKGEHPDDGIPNINRQL